MSSNINAGIFNSKNINNQDVEDIIENYTFTSTQASDGSPITPSFTFAEDTDTGLYRIGNNNLGITTGGEKRIDIQSAGTLISTPVAITDSTDSSDTASGAFIVNGGLAVAKNLNVGGQFVLSNLELSTTGELTNGEDEKIAFTSSSIDFQVDGTSELLINGTNTTFSSNLVVPSNSTILNTGNDGLAINDSGSYVSIQTGGFENLQVNSDETKFQSSKHTFKPLTVLSTEYDAIFQVGDGISGWEDLVKINESKLKSNVPLRVGNGSESKPSYSFSGETDSGLYKIGENNLGISVGGVKQLDIDQNNTLVTNILQVNEGTGSSIEINTSNSSYPTIQNGSTADALQICSFGDVDIVCDCNNNANGKSIRFLTNGENGAGTELFKVEDSGGATLLEEMKTGDGLFSTPSYSFSSDSSIGIYNSDGAINIKSGSTDGVFIKENDPDFSLSIHPRGLDHSNWQEFRMCGKNGFDRKFMAWEAWNGGGGINDMPEIFFYVNTGGDSTPNETNTFKIGQVGAQALDGDEFTPAYSFINDINTGIYRIGSDNMGLSVID